MRAVRWLWPKRVPLGKVTILGGLPGQGKSQLTCYLAAATTTGKLAGDLYGEPADVLIISAEDDPEDTIKPRLYVAGADMARVHVISMRSIIHGRPGGVHDPPTDRHGGRRGRHGGIRRAPGDLGPGGGAAGRRPFRPLQPAGTRCARIDPRHGDGSRSAALLVSHLLTKAPPGADALARLADSHAFAGLPRSVLYLTPHPDDEAGERGSRKLLIAAKGNLLPPGNHALEVTVEDAVAGLDDDDRRPVNTSRVVIGAEADLSSDDALMSSSERTEFQAAVRFLREHLADSEAWAEDVKNGRERRRPRGQDVAQRPRARDLPPEGHQQSLDLGPARHAQTGHAGAGRVPRTGALVTASHARTRTQHPVI